MEPRYEEAPTPRCRLVRPANRLEPVRPSTIHCWSVPRTYRAYGSLHSIQSFVSRDVRLGGRRFCRTCLPVFLSENHDLDCHEEDAKVQPHREILDVVQVVAHLLRLFFETVGISITDLGPTGNAGQ